MKKRIIIAGLLLVISMVALYAVVGGSPVRNTVSGTVTCLCGTQHSATVQVIRKPVHEDHPVLPVASQTVSVRGGQYSITYPVEFGWRYFVRVGQDERLANGGGTFHFILPGGINCPVIAPPIDRPILL
jgi:hypothetical protein